MTYEIFGPYALEEKRSVEDYRTRINHLFVDGIQDDGSSLATAIGVYVWTHLKNGRQVPWNVGLTNRGFKARFLQKENSFLRLSVDGQANNVQVYLLALKTARGRFVKPSSRKIRLNDWLESMLIRSALEVNNDLRNSAKVKELKETVVAGYLNDQGAELTPAAKSFKKLLGKRLR